MTRHGKMKGGPPAIAFVFSLLFFVAASSPAEPQRPIFSVQFMRIPSRGAVAGAAGQGKFAPGYTDVQFLTDNLLLLCLNSRGSFSDQPDSVLALFDVDQKKLVRSAQYPVEKIEGSVVATQNGNFVVLNQKGIHLCSVDLICGPAFATKGPMRVLPGGTQILAGGYAQTEVDILDASTLQMLRPAPENLAISINDETLLNGSAMINDDTLAEIHYPGRAQVMPVIDVRGRELYRIPVIDLSDAMVIPNRSGSRFCLFEAGYTRWNKMVNFLDIDSSRLPNFARVRVFDTSSGKQLFILRWDPRPSSVRTPAISPDGHRIALIRHATLEVFETP
jgi:hypothetical protein